SRDGVAGAPGGPAQREPRLVRQIREGVTRELVTGAAVELEVARTCSNVGCGLCEGLAAIARFDQRELLSVLLDRAPELRKKSTFLRGRESAPAAIERAT